MDAVVGAVFNAVQGSKEESPGGNISRLEAMALMNEEEDDESIFPLSELFGDVEEFQSIRVVKNNKRR